MILTPHHGGAYRTFVSPKCPSPAIAHAEVAAPLKSCLEYLWSVPEPAPSVLKSRLQKD